MPTLLDDWLQRRELLNAGGDERDPFKPVKLKVLDYLISRYRGTEQARSPVFSPCPRETILYRRAVLAVHLADKKDTARGGAASGQGGRVRDYVERLEHGPGAAGGEQAERRAPCPAAADLAGALEKLKDRSLYSIASDISELQAIRRKALDAVAALIGQERKLPEEALDFLADLMFVSQAYCREAAELMVRCRNPLPHGHVLSVLRDVSLADNSSSVASLLVEFLRDPKTHEATMEALAWDLADERRWVRKKAVDLYTRLGGPGDVGLLLDLLSASADREISASEREGLADAIWHMTVRLTGSDQPK